LENKRNNLVLLLTSGILLLRGVCPSVDGATLTFDESGGRSLLAYLLCGGQTVVMETTVINTLASTDWSEGFVGELNFGIWIWIWISSRQGPWQGHHSDGLCSHGATWL